MIGIPDPINSLGEALSLTREERVALSKLVRPPEESLRNALKAVPPHLVRGTDLGVDGFNVLITVERALAGDPVYLCSDGIVRDLTLSRSSYEPSGFFREAVNLLSEVIRSLEPGNVTIYLDSPVPRSGSIAESIRELTGKEFEVRTSRRVDADVISHDIVASSDSRIIGEAKAVVDLAAVALSKAGISPKKLFTNRGFLAGFRDDRST